MSNRFFSYHNKAVALVNAYHHEIPLSHYLKKYFSENKKHGSKDRKWISHFCFSFYRLGQALKDINIDQRMMVAVYLCTENTESLDDYIPLDWHRSPILDERIQYAEKYVDFQLKQIFPYAELLMPEINIVEYNKSLLRQPNVFVRVRPNKEKIVQQKLANNDIEFTTINAQTIAFKNRVDLEKIFDINKEIVIQDLSSQAIATLFPSQEITTIWDCCAASGGKTILAHDYYPDAEITVSDIRPSILHNHRKRMQEAGVPIFHSFVQDLTKEIKQNRKKYDLIILDAPCSGSGTWARNPEELYFFDKNGLKKFIDVQKNICARLLPHVSNGGFLLYITCSIFMEENTNVLANIPVQSVDIVHTKLINNINQRADSMFGILLQKK